MADSLFPDRRVCPVWQAQLPDNYIKAAGLMPCAMPHQHDVFIAFSIGRQMRKQCARHFWSLAGRKAKGALWRNASSAHSQLHQQHCKPADIHGRELPVKAEWPHIHTFHAKVVPAPCARNRFFLRILAILFTQKQGSKSPAHGKMRKFLAAHGPKTVNCPLAIRICRSIGRQKKGNFHYYYL